MSGMSRRRAKRSEMASDVVGTARLSTAPLSLGGRRYQHCVTAVVARRAEGGGDTGTHPSAALKRGRGAVTSVVG